MAIQFSCPQCGNTLEVPDGTDGKDAKCPACSAVLPVKAVPSDPQEPDATNPQETANPQDSTNPEETTNQGESATHPASGQSVAQQTKPAENLGGLDDRSLATIAHASGLIGIFAGGLIGFIGPLVIYLTCHETSSFVGNQAKEALNFQISLFFLAIAVVIITVLSCGILWPVLFLPLILQIVIGIIATTKVWSGESYRYPMTLRLVD